MIVGKGNIASVLKDRDDVTFFASGVSNSQETDEDQYFREKELLLSQDRQKHLVYFSSLSIYRSNDRYNKHKKEMEDMVRHLFNSYTIVRVEVIAWGKNPTTIHNVFRKKIENKEPITVIDAYRYIVTEEEFTQWLDLIPVGEKNEMNIPGERFHVYDILKMVKDEVL
jgi:hypothetical protein